MDSRLKASYDFSNYRITLQNEIDQYTAEFNETLVVGHGGGFFTVSLELINFIDLQIRNSTTNVVLIDNKSTPVLIDDVAEFNKLITNIYTIATNKYYASMTELKKKRSIKKLIEE